VCIEVTAGKQIRKARTIISANYDANNIIMRYLSILN
jgi:hypothetical protein